MEWMIGFGILIYPTIADFRKKQFYILPVILSGMIINFFYLCQNEHSVYYVLAGIIPGIILYIISFITKGAVGKGDALVVGILGMILGWKRMSCILLIALFLAGIVSLFLIVIKKVGRKKSIPFIPFLTIAIIIRWIYLQGWLF